MGEANAEAAALTARELGYEPVHGETSDGRQCLRIGGLEIVATEFALWSDARVFDHGGGRLSISWGGRTIALDVQPDGSWSAV